MTPPAAHRPSQAAAAGTAPSEKTVAKTVPERVAPAEGSPTVEDAAPRWRRRPEERPQEIIDAAFAEFSDQGLGGARLEQIARRAGVSKGTIYLYFSSKEELFRAVVEAKVVTVIADAELDAGRGAARDQTAADELQRYMRRHWEYLRSPTYLAMYRLVQSELHHFPDLMRYYGDEVIERSLRLTASIISRGVARGEFDTTDPLVSARLIAAMLITHALWHERRHLYRSSMHASADVVRDTVIEFALRSLAATPAAPHSPSRSSA